MLGFDWLTAQKARWDFNAKTLTLHGVTVPLCTHPSQIGIRRVYVMDRVQIPANTEKNVPVKLVNSTWRSPASADWVVHPKQIEECVFTSRVLLPGETRLASVRMLNNVMYKDSYPLPNISDCLDAFKGSSWFGLLDLRSSFYKVPLADADRDKTAFITRRGQWHFCLLPMGLSNSPAMF